MPFAGKGQNDDIIVSIKPLKDTLHPFDILEFEVKFMVLKQRKAYLFEASSLIQVKMVEPDTTDWIYYDNFFTHIWHSALDPRQQFNYPQNFTATNILPYEEYVPDKILTSSDLICTGAYRPGRYILRVAYSPDELIGYYHNRLESCESCIIDTALVIVTDRYPEKDQAAFDWLVRDKHYCNLQKRNYESYHLEEFIKTGEEFLHLFPESSFVPYVHCKIGESILKIYEKNAEESKLPPAEAAQKLEAIVTHLSFCKLLKKDEMLSMYYAGMYKKYKDILLRFKVRHGIK